MPPPKYESVIRRKKLEISVIGNKAIYHATDTLKGDVEVDFTPHLALIERVMANLIAAKDPKLICIEGMSGSGKTGFSKVLGHNGTNVQVIDVCSLHEHSKPRVDISNLISDRNATYVIDETGFMDQECFPLIESHVCSGGKMVVMLQSKRDLCYTLRSKALWLKLDRSGLHAYGVAQRYAQRGSNG